jgi:DNA invertase Pin-like site-specific DNA recombinase
MRNLTIQRLLAYRRVSTGVQGITGTSLDGQKDELAQLAAHLKAPVVVDFMEVESGAAEKEERRVEVARLIEAVRPGDVVAVAKFDRFTRDLEFAIRKVREILGKGGRFISIAEGEFDRSPEGELKLSIWASIAQMERARIYDRTHGQKVRLRAQGKFVDGLPPFGYLRAKGRDGSDKPRRLVVDPVTAPIVVEMFERCLRGESARNISLRLRETSPPGVRRHLGVWVTRALRNRVYTGQTATTPIRGRGASPYAQGPAQWVDTHEPIVSTDVWLRAQAALTSRRKGGDRPHAQSGTEKFLLRGGLATCGICDGRIGCCPWSPKSKMDYYVCRRRRWRQDGGPPCPHAPYVQQREVDPDIERATLARLVELRELLAAAPKHQPQAPDLEAKRAHIAARRKRLVQAIASGKLSLDDIDAPLAELDAELADVETATAEHAARATADTVEGRRAALAFVDGVSTAWAGLLPGERRSVLALLAERIVLTAERKVEITWRDASGLSAAVGGARGELVARMTSAAPPVAGSASDRIRSRSAKPAHGAVRPAA